MTAAMTRLALVREVAMRTPAARRRALVLLWHRVRPDGSRPESIVPTVSVDLFRRQLQALTTLGDIVPLSAIDEPDQPERPRFALTFDDDDPGHARHALPVLQKLGVPATFFLSGRWLHGLGPYWWERLETRIADDGLEAVATRLGCEASSPADLAASVEGTPLVDRIQQEMQTDPDVPEMTGDDARLLVASGMEVGFHTVHHPVLTNLSDERLRAEVHDGRAELAADVGTTVERFAYPHGKVDGRVADAVAAAGYASAWTTTQWPAIPAEPAALRGRWEPGPRSSDALVRGALRRLNLRRRR